VQDLYLAGGTGIAVHRGHRTSLDIDLFSKAAEFELDGARTELLAKIPSVRVLEQTDVTLRVRCGNVPLDIVRYPYALLDPTGVGPSGITLAGLRDLASMKLAAIARRGIRRDFWDLWEIVRGGLSHVDIAESYLEKFGVAEADLYHVLKWRSICARDASTDFARDSPGVGSAAGAKGWDRAISLTRSTFGPRASRTIWSSMTSSHPRISSSTFDRGSAREANLIR